MTETLQRLIPSVVFLLLLRTSDGSGDSTGERTNHVEPDICARVMERIFYGKVTVPTPPDITGEWTSERCEVRPGPEYVLRKYRFEATSRFSAHIYYYSDADCVRPLYLVQAEGTHALLHESWTVPGGTEVDYELQQVAVMMYTDETARRLGARINDTCPDMHPPWKPYEHYVIFTYNEETPHGAGGGQEEKLGGSARPGGEGDDNALDSPGAAAAAALAASYAPLEADCTSALHFSFHELQLMRMEERRYNDGGGHGSMRQLYLGDIHTDRHQRQVYRPTSYQEPLVPAQDGCTVCIALLNSNDYYPPSLKRTNTPKVSLSGEWFSERCETRPNGMFLTRRLLFAKDERSWEGYYYHYDDALCREPTFTIHAVGTYSAGATSREVDRSRNYDFKVSQVKITPGDHRMAVGLNADEACGGADDIWVAGKERDVTSSQGCPSLGIRVPHTEYEIVRLEKDQHKMMLFLGQRPSDGSHPSTPQKRPTSFQSPLVKCSKPISVTPPTVKKYVRQTAGATCRTASLQLVGILTFFIFAFSKMAGGP